MYSLIFISTVIKQPETLHDLAFGIVIALIFVTLIMFFCVVLIRLYFNKIKNYTRLIYQKDIDFQKALNATILETQDQILNNISQDLHDDAGQQLTYINFQIENLRLDSPNLHSILEPVSQSVANLSESVRSISHSLNNQLITQQDLLKSIEAEIERIRKNAKFTITLTISDNPKKTFGTNEKIVVYRIFQEIINNIFKHSKATEVIISIATNPYFEMFISDNGKGFDSENPSNKTAIGLKNIVSRAAIIGYTLTIASSTGNGTTITLSQNTN